MDAVKDALFWVAVGAATAPIWGAFLWELWEGGI